MRGVFGKASRVGALATLLIVGTAASADGLVDPPQARLQPPVGVTSQARVQPPVGVTRFVIWLAARMGIPIP
jgi:hypothetical protein